MYIKKEDKELDKLLDSIDKLLSKLSKFNINHMCNLVFGFNKNNLEVIPIVYHIDSHKEKYEDYIKNIGFIVNFDDSLEKTEDEEKPSSFDFNKEKLEEKKKMENLDINQDDITKFIERYDPLSIIHNVVLSSDPIDLSLERDDIYIYSKPINIVVVKKFKEFLLSGRILSVDFTYDEMLNTFNINRFLLKDEDSPITLRLKKNYLTILDNDVNFFDFCRNNWINKEIKELCQLYSDPKNPNKGVYVLSKEDNQKEELEFNINDTKILISKEFFKATVKTIDFVFHKYESLEDIVTIAVLAHIEYSNNHQYIFYKYYNF